MVIVAGHLVVDASDRERQLAALVPLLEQARVAPGCLDYSMSADLLDPARIDILERWESRAALEAFRGSGTSEDRDAAIVSACVAEYDVADVRQLAG